VEKLGGSQRGLSAGQVFRTGLVVGLFAVSTAIAFGQNPVLRWSTSVTRGILQFAPDNTGDFYYAYRVPTAAGWTSSLSKYSAGGGLLWTKSFLPSDDNKSDVGSIVTDPLGNVYAIWDGAGQTPSNEHCFITKFDSTGHQIYVTPSIDYPSGYDKIQADHNGNLYAIQPTWVQPVTINKFGPTGSLLWSKQSTTSGNEYLLNFSVSSNGQSYALWSLLGNPLSTQEESWDANGSHQWTHNLASSYYSNYSSFWGSADDTGVYSVVSSKPGMEPTGGNAHLVKLSPSNHQIYDFQFSGPGADNGIGIEGAFDGSVYVRHLSSTGNNPFIEDALVKIDASGHVLWTKDSAFLNEFNNPMTIGVDGSVYNVTQNAGFPYIEKFAPDGHLVWAYQFPGVKASTLANFVVDPHTGDFLVETTDQNGNVTTLSRYGQAPEPVKSKQFAAPNTVLTVASPGVLSDASYATGATAVISTQPTHGTAVVHADGSYVYTPAAGFIGSDTFTFVAQKGTLKSDPTVVNVITTPMTGFTTQANTFGGNTIPATITLTGKAPAGGVLVTITSNNPAIPSPQSFPVYAGSTWAPVHIATTGVTANTVITLIAKCQSVGISSIVTVQPAVLLSLTSGTSTVGGSVVTLTVHLNGVAPAGGATVSLSSDHPSLVSMPGSVKVPAGASSVTVNVNTSKVTAGTAVKFTASYGSGTVTDTVSLTS
jgi:hypothetical protein